MKIYRAIAVCNVCEEGGEPEQIERFFREEKNALLFIGTIELVSNQWSVSLEEIEVFE